MKLITTIYNPSDIKILKKADGYIVGNNEFGIRLARSFSIDEIILSKQIALSENKLLYVQVNRIFHDLSLVEEHLLFLKSLDVDGIYFGDLGVLTIARKLNIDHLLIYNPETLITNSYDTNFYLKQKIKAVTLSKEINIEEIEAINDNACGDLEFLAHGYLHMFYSKRALLSSYNTINNLDLEINYKKTIQEISSDEVAPILEEKWGTSISTPYIFTSLNHIKDIVKKNIKYVRIDGIFGEIDYLAEVVAAYHQVLFENKPYSLEMLANHYKDKTFKDGFLFL